NGSQLTGRAGRRVAPAIRGVDHVVRERAERLQKRLSQVRVRHTVVQRGTHDELVAVPGPYREIYDLQLRDQEEAIASIAAATGAVHLRPALVGASGD
ncbi:MAG: hypothetical protein WHX53_07865, partial [Anaerolineae bacterium]